MSASYSSLDSVYVLDFVRYELHSCAGKGHADAHARLHGRTYTHTYAHMSAARRTTLRRCDAERASALTGKFTHKHALTCGLGERRRCGSSQERDRIVPCR